MFGFPASGLALALVLAMALATSACSGTGGPGGAAATTTTRPPPVYYLALGDSLAAGFQPIPDHPKGVVTDRGYADVLESTERATRPGLTLVKLACPGETTTTMIKGGICHYGAGSQLSAATDFLRSHARSMALVTIDIGANNVDGCGTGGRVDVGCVARGVASLTSESSTIYDHLRAAAPAGLRMVTMNLYDPYLAAYLEGPAGQALARASLPLLRTVNATIATVAGRHGVATADVAAAFDSYDLTATVPLAGHGTVPVAVARVCQLTWICSPAPLGPNIHPDDAGYRVIAGALAPLTR
ncbi:MAG TPA: SGNH/GDSL hydrolase family protein [Acidimicrobiales bacterium]|nr:SGNH/GDSL hydrolase family protein [Acidimicrobiales bacterium]